MKVKVTFATIIGENTVLVAEIIAQSINAAWERLIRDDPCWRTILVMAHDVTGEPETSLGMLKNCIKQYTGEDFQKMYPQWMHVLEKEKMP